MWLWSAALAAPVDDVANPRPSGWVADAADALPPEVEARLNGQIDALHRDLDAEIAVVTVPSVGTSSASELASSLLEAWGIGDARAQNGLVMVLAVDRRELDVETGDGLRELLSEVWLDELATRVLATGTDADALSDAVQAIDERLREHPDDARRGAQRGPVDDDAVKAARVQEVAVEQGLHTLEVTGVLAASIAIGVAGASGLVVYVRRRERTCPDCKLFMPMLPEDEDDQHLTPGQVTEERIGSVDYQVHQCPKCGQTRTFVVHEFVTSYQPCPRCNNRTREVLYTEEGELERVEERCEHCDYAATYTREIA